MTRGIFITFEGGEGGGKSTQSKLLAEELRRRGIDVVTTREPGGSPGAEEIRALLVKGSTDRWDPMSETLLHLAARRDHVARIIEPALQSGSWVICDRFADSTKAYQGYGLGFDLRTIADLHKIALGEFKPDLTLILDLPPEAGIGRALGRGGAETRYERMDGGFHERMRQGFLDIAAQEPQRCKLIDARNSIEDVHAAILAILQESIDILPR